MRYITVHCRDGKVYEVRAEVGAKHGRLLVPCPHCGAEPGTIRGGGIAGHDRDTYYADAVTVCCGAPFGELRVRVETLFGIEEDEAMLHGRPRVYG